MFLLARKEKERKQEKNIALSRSNCISLNVLFDSFSYEQIKNKMAANKEELPIAVQKYPAIFNKSNKGFHHKPQRREAVARELGFENGKLWTSRLYN